MNNLFLQPSEHPWLRYCNNGFYITRSLCNTTCIHIPCVNISSINWNPLIPVNKHYLTDKYAPITTLPASMYQLWPYRQCVQTTTLPARMYQLSPSRQACINYQYHLTLPLHMFMTFLQNASGVLFFKLYITLNICNPCYWLILQ